MIVVEGRIMKMDERGIEVEYRTFNGIVRRIRIFTAGTRTLQDAHLFEEPITIELEEGR